MRSPARCVSRAAVREAGVVETEPCGRFAYDKLRPEVLDTLAGSFAARARTARAPRKGDVVDFRIAQDLR